MPSTAPTCRFASLVTLTACGTLLLTACGGSRQATAPAHQSATADAPFIDHTTSVPGHQATEASVAK